MCAHVPTDPASPRILLLAFSGVRVVDPAESARRARRRRACLRAGRARAAGRRTA